MTISKFRRGDVNCLFATSIAEEGIDIPDCNLIIRFDLCQTMIQYIQSRGRARHKDSVYIKMVEMGNGMHRRAVLTHTADEDRLRNFCRKMPADRKLTGNNFEMDYFLRKERSQRQYTVPSTGARLNYRQSLVILNSFLATLPHPPEAVMTAEYVVSGAPGGFLCEVILPSCSPVRRAVGKVHTTKQVAKGAAAFELCLELLRKRYLDQHLNPVFMKQLPAMRNARLAISSKKRDEYGMRTKPEMWSVLGIPEQLYATVLVLSHPDSMDRASRPLIMLTRQAIPQVDPFPLFFGKGRASHVRCLGLKEPLKPTSDELGSLTEFTLRIFLDVFSKQFEATSADLPYLLAPSIHGHDFSFTDLSDARSAVDWDSLLYIRTIDQIALNGNEPDDFFGEKFVADPYDGSRKFVLKGIRKDLKPRDPVPEGVLHRARRAWKDEPHNILNYSVSLWGKARSRRVFKEDQPVVEAELVSLRRNLLDDSFDDEDAGPKTCFIILETLRISSVRHLSRSFRFKKS